MVQSSLFENTEHNTDSSSKSTITLFKLDNKANIRFWEANVEKTLDNTIGLINTRWGFWKSENIQTASKLVHHKNNNKANYTNGYESALLEMESMAKSKLNEGYIKYNQFKKLDDDEFKDILSKSVESNYVKMHKPMLAKNIKDVKKLPTTIAVQPKLDGHRLLVRIDKNGISAYSRTLKPVDIYYLKPTIQAVSKIVKKYTSITLDGELYAHDLDFNTLSSIIRAPRKATKEQRAKIQYHIYDCFTPMGEESFMVRNLIVNDLVSNCDNNSLQKVKTHFIGGPLSNTKETDQDNIQSKIIKYHDQYKSKGYEGLMVRDYKSLYEHKRSYNLLKVKNFTDAEFEVLNIVPALDDTALFVCAMPNSDKTFRCRMATSLQTSKGYLEHKENYIGQLLTVKFFEYTPDGIPRFPIGKTFKFL